MRFLGVSRVSERVQVPSLTPGLHVSDRHCPPGGVPHRRLGGSYEIVHHTQLLDRLVRGSAPESVEVVDVAQMLLGAVRGGTPASPTPCAPGLVSGPMECTSARRSDCGTHGGGAAGRISKKIQAWLSIRRQGVRRR